MGNSTDDLMEFAIAFCVFVAVVYLFFHIFQAIAVWRFAKKDNNPHYRLAVIPVVSTFLMYEIALKRRGSSITAVHLIVFFVILGFITPELTFFIFPYIYIPIKYYAYFRLTRKYYPKSISQVFFPFITLGMSIPFYLLSVSNTFKDDI